MSIDAEKQRAAEAAAGLIHNGMTVGLGTGSTTARLLKCLSTRRLSVRYIASSPATEHAATRLGLRVEPFGSIDRLDIAIDGADQISMDGWLIKGGGAAQTREKVIAAGANRFVVIADSSKPVRQLRGPVPVEILTFGLRATLRRLGQVSLRDVPASPDGGIIADYHGPFGEPIAVANLLSTTPGVVEHGIFPAAMVTDIIVAHDTNVEHRQRRPEGFT